MFKRKTYCKLGLGYFLLMLMLSQILPEWVGEENGIIENLQLLWLAAGFAYCLQAKKSLYKDWLVNAKDLWNAGMIYFFMLFMREISWGRALLHNADGSIMQYSQMSLYGLLVHPLVGCLIISLLILLYKARVWRIFRHIDFPSIGFLLLLLFILGSWIAEKGNLIVFHGQVGEELAEFGAYMMMYFLLSDAGYQLKQLNR